MSQAQCTATSAASCDSVDGQDTSTHVGGSKEKPLPTPPTMPITSQPKWKPDGGSGYSSTSNTKIEMGSLLQGESADEAQEEVAKRKLERDAHDAEEAAAKKIQKKNSLPVPNEIHMKIRAAADEEAKWEKDLEVVHGLAEEEVSMVMRIVMKHYNDSVFPKFDPSATRGIDFYRALAKPGWDKMQKCKDMTVLYPREGAEQTCINGVWKMIPAYDW